MKNIKTFIIIIFSILNFSACNTPEPIDQDGTMLWLANGRSYEEVLGSVETRIDSALSKEEYHIYNADGKNISAFNEVISQGLNTVTLNRKHFQNMPGLYFVRLIFKDISFIKKVILLE